jgi:hypothetical protein
VRARGRAGVARACQRANARMAACGHDKLASGSTSRIQRIGLVRTQGRIMIARRSFLVALWIGFALACVGAKAAEPSATSFVEAIYAPYKIKDGLVLDLIKLKGGWRIADINWGRKQTLRALFIKK